MEKEISAIVLAGGRSARMGTDKAFLRLGGKALVEHVLERVACLSDDVMVVARDLDAFEGLPARLVEDVPGPPGALTGLYSGLRCAAHDLALAVACDMPFLNLKVLRYMTLLAPGHDVVIPRIDGYLEPLHAYYRRTCLGPMEELMRQGRQKIVAFFPQVRVRVVEGKDLELLDPERRSFVNVNTPADWEAVQALLAEARE